MTNIPITPITPSTENEWDFVDGVLDEQLEIEHRNAESTIKALEQQEQELKDSKDSKDSKKVAKATKSDFDLRFRITDTSTKVEFLTGVCSPDPKCVALNLDNPNNTSSVDSTNATNATNASNTSNDTNTSNNTLPTTQHPNSIRKYVASMLAFFSNIRAEYLTDCGTVEVQKIPIFYGNREKLVSIEQHEFNELMNGNVNFLPRGSLVIESMQYDATRQQNKNIGVNTQYTLQGLSTNNPYATVQSTPSPYNITVKLNIITRGMNDAMQIVEQISAFFNPYYTFNLVEQGMDSSIRLQLDNVLFETPEIDQFSSNEIMLEFAFTLYGNMYKPSYRENLATDITLNIKQL